MQVETYGLARGVLAASRSLWSGVAHRLSGLRPRGGQNVYDFDWDVLVVLDTCRVDALTQVSEEYEFLPDGIPSIRSVGPDSHTWVDRTFTPAYRDEIARTAYLSGNPHTDGFADGTYAVDADDFLVLDNVFESGFDEAYGTVPPRAITDRAVSYLRANDPGRTILHYMQPHTPYRGLDLDGIGQSGPNGYRETVWDHVQAGLLSRDEAWEHYLDNLRWVLDDLAVLLDSVDAASVVITADHGECFGEYGAYAHSASGEFDVLRTVPWVETSASDDGSYEPAPTRRPDTDVDVETQLEHLGYM
jgi:hypothetical protein